MTQESRLAIVIDSSQARPSAENLARAMLALDEAGVRVSGTTQNVGAQMQRMAGQSNAAAAALRRGLIATLGSLSTMRVIDIADEWGQYASRIRMATQSVEEYDTVQARMLQSANQTYRNISETREAFIQMSPVIRQMGASLEQSMDVVDAFSGLLVINAANGERGAAAMRALSLSMQKGRMDAQNWMTIASTMPSLIDEIAAHTGRSADEIRKLGAEGKLSIQMLVDALGGRYEAVMKKVADMPTTVRDALTNVSNAFGEYIGRHNEANQVTATLAAGIEVLGKNIETVLNYALVAGAGALVSYAGGMAKAGVQTALKGMQSSRAAAQELVLARAQAAQTEATLAQVRALATLTPAHAQVTAATLANEQAQKRLALAQAATATVGRGLLGILGGPVGMAVSAALVASSFIDMGGSAKTAALDMDALRGSTEEATKAFAKLGALSRQAALDKLTDLHADQVDDASIAWIKFVQDLKPTTAKGAKAVADMRAGMRAEIQAIIADTNLAASEMEQAISDLIGKWVDAGKITEQQGNVYRATAAEAAGLQSAANQTGQRLEELNAKAREMEAASRAAASGVTALNAALAETNEAGKSYLERLSDRALLAGLKTQREQLQALIDAGKVILSPEDQKKAFADADRIDRANRSIKTGASAVKELQSAIRSLLDTHLPEKKALEDLQNNQALLNKLRDAGKISAQEYEIAQRSITATYEKQIGSIQHQIEMERVLRDLREQKSTAQMQFMRELDAFGQGENVRALNADLAKVEDQYRRLIEARRNSAQGLSDEEHAQIQAALQDELEMVRWFHDEKRKIEQDGTLGAIKALKDYADESKNLYKQVEGAVKNAFQGMEDALLNFVTKGKLDFRSLADSIIRDMIRIAIQQSVTGPLANMFGGLIGGAFAGGAGGGYPAHGGNWSFDSGGYTGAGGKYEPAGIVHRGEGVLNQDEIRALGGESGFNALRRAIRGPGHAAGGMAGRPALPSSVLSTRTGDVNVTVNVSSSGAPQTQAPSDWQQFAKGIGDFVQAEIRAHEIKSQRPGGTAWQARQGAFA